MFRGISIKTLTKLLKKKDKDVEVKEDTPTSYRIFIYSQKQKFPITSLIDKLRGYNITKISDYPQQKEHYPICVVRIEKLRIMRKYKKRKKSATDTKIISNIKLEK